MTTIARTFRSYADQLPASAPAPVLVPIFDSLGREATRHRGVALRSPDGSLSAPRAIVGSRFAPPSLAAVGAALDAATADLGGFARLGPARIRVTDRALSVVLGRAAGDGGAMLAPVISGDPSQRAIYFRLDSPFDGTGAESFDAFMVRVLCSNGAVGWGSIGGFNRAHTANLGTARASWAGVVRGDIPRALEAQARTLTALRDVVRLPKGETYQTIARIAYPEAFAQGETHGDLTPRKRATVDKITDYVIGADGHYVPEGIHGPDVVDGLQVLEACTAFDRHSGRGDVDARRDRVMAGRGVGTLALSWGIRTLAALGVDVTRPAPLALPA